MSRDLTELSVLLVDDHDLFRTGLRTVLGENGLQIVGEAATGTQAVELCGRLAPDVVVMDLRMPGMSGVEATRLIAARHPHSRVLVLTISADEGDVMDAIVAGASGYLLKDAGVGEVLAGIEAVARGEALVSPQIAGKLLDRVRAQAARPTPSESAIGDLSERELQVLRLIADGLDNTQIAADLVISPKTVKNHISNILMKLQMENRIQAAVYAVRCGIV